MSREAFTEAEWNKAEATMYKRWFDERQQLLDKLIRERDEALRRLYEIQKFLTKENVGRALNVADFYPLD